MSTEKEQILEELLLLSRHLGDPSHDWAMLGEGNTSGRIDDTTFYVKASGSSLRTLTMDQVTEVNFAPILEALNSKRSYSDKEVAELLLASCVGSADKMPSVETLFHAFLLSLPDIKFIGHTHVTSINGILCSETGWEIMQAKGRLFPDEIVVCGEAPCLVPYVDPGITLAREIKKAVEEYIVKYDSHPRTIYLQNHGFIAVGKSSKEAEAITMMADKAARVLTGAMLFGQVSFLSPEHVARIRTRPDEHYRQRALGLAESIQSD
jgi:rhamnose utilization protein RhaD (predicted bifunctional aldolase and dehydrogenase)